MTRHTIDSQKTSPSPSHRPLIARVSRLEWIVAGVFAVILVVLTIAEPAIVEAPFENARTVGFTFGGTIAAAIALVVMLRLRVPPPVRVVVLAVPFVAVSWWLLSPFFIDDEVDDEFETSIAAALDASDPSTSGTTIASSPAGTGAPASSAPGPTDAGAGGPAAPPRRTLRLSPGPAEPVLLGVGQFAGLAGHEGRGDAGLFERVDGSLVLRFENFDIQNGPDLRVYLVSGRDQFSPTDGSLYLGELRGNVGDQTYELPADFTLIAGDWTVLVWCEAFSVEFVGATIAVA